MRANEGTAAAVIETTAGISAIAVVAVALVVVSPAADVIGQILIMAITVGVLAARCRRWHAAVAIAVAAALIFPTCVAQDGVALSADLTPWGFTPLVIFALLLGRGYRRLGGAGLRPDPSTRDDTDGATGRSPQLIGLEGRSPRAW